MLSQPQRATLFIPILALGVIPTPQQGAPETVTFDSNYMTTQLVHQVDPDYPWVPTSPTAPPPWCSFTIVTGLDGSVRTVGPQNWIPGNCAEPYFSSAKRAVRLWTWKPQFKDGTPVQATFYVTVKYGSTGSSPVSILDSNRQTAVSIVLKSGSTIHADTIKQQGKYVSYTIGEDSYEIPADMVDKIVNQDTPAPKPATLPGATAVWRTQPGFESLADLRRACASDSTHFAVNFHLPNYPDTCAALGVDMGSDYEQNVDDAVRMAQTLCAKYEGPVQYVPRSKDDPTLAGAWQVYQDRFTKFQNAQSDVQQKLSAVSPISFDQFIDLSNERMKLINRLDNDAQSGSPKDHLQPQERAAIQDRVNDIEKMLDPNDPEREKNPQYRAAQLRYIRTQIDLARVTVTCIGSATPK